jgi:lactoylglutathione lyase
MKLTLIVIRSSDAQALAGFYSKLGLTFDYHKHGNSPYHYAATIGETVIEIYPLLKTQGKSDEGLRLGFTITDFDSTIHALKTLNTKFVAEPMETEWGYMAIVQDPDGRKLELYKADA